MQFPIKGLSTAIGLAVLSLSTLHAQVRPLPVIPPDSLVQTYTGRLAHTLLNHYVTQDSLNARLNAYVSQDHLNATLDGYVLHDDLNTALSGYVTTSDSRLSDSRTPKGTASGSLTGTYPNPAIKSSVNLPGSPTTTTQTASDNSTKVATTAYVKSNLTNYVTNSDARLSDNRIPKGTAGGDLTGAYPNPTIKSSVTLTGNPTVSGNLTTGGTLTVNGTGESLIKGNLRLKGSSAYGNKINLGDGDYVYLHEATDDNLTVKAKSITLAPTTAVTAPTPATTDNSTKVATTAYVKSAAIWKLTANFEYMTTSPSDKVYIEPFHRGGQKMNDEKAFICRIISKDLEWCSAALVGNTYASVQITAATIYAGNYIYQMADGRYINIINKEGQVGGQGYVLLNTGTEDIKVRSAAVWLPCSMDYFISNISQFSF